jgi:uncharacterized repeat protein (TIGR03803 family)
MEKLAMRVSRTVFSTKNLNRSDVRNLGVARLGCVALVFLAAVSVSYAQTYSVVASFDGGNGELPQVPLVQGADGNFYGTTMNGGTSLASGTVFKVSPTGGFIASAPCPTARMAGSLNRLWRWASTAIFTEQLT